METESQPQVRFKNQMDWNNFLQQFLKTEPESRPDLFSLRKECYSNIEKIRERPLIVYASQFIDRVANAPVSIELSDIDGFTDLISSTDGSRSIDVLIHSPGGNPDATERIVGLLRSRFDEVHFLIPHSAYSAATMLALSGDSITLHPSATLGPIDPQLGGNPARSIKKGFEKVRDLIKKSGPETLPAYIPLIEKYSLHLLELCDDSEKLAKELVGDWLKKYMLKSEKYQGQVDEVVEFFSNYDLHLLHSRPITFDKLERFKLNLTLAKDTLSGLLWEAYILLSGFFKITPFVKLYENTRGINFGINYTPTIPSASPPQKKNEIEGLNI